MIIEKFKKKFIITSVCLIIIGLVISIVGFGICSFDLNTFESNDTQKWYKTINIDEDSFSFTIGF